MPPRILKASGATGGLRCPFPSLCSWYNMNGWHRASFHLGLLFFFFTGVGEPASTNLNKSKQDSWRALLPAQRSEFRNFGDWGLTSRRSLSACCSCIL